VWKGVRCSSDIDRLLHRLQAAPLVRQGRRAQKICGERGEVYSSSEVDRFLHSLQAAPLVRQVERLKYVWKGGVMATHPLDRSLKIQKAVFLQNKNFTLYRNSRHRYVPGLWIRILGQENKGKFFFFHFCILEVPVRNSTHYRYRYWFLGVFFMLKL
jgi:hypothetical protein